MYVCTDGHFVVFFAQYVVQYHRVQTACLSRLSERGLEPTLRRLLRDGQDGDPIPLDLAVAVLAAHVGCDGVVGARLEFVLLFGRPGLGDDHADRADHQADELVDAVEHAGVGDFAHLDVHEPGRAHRLRDPRRVVPAAVRREDAPQLVLAREFGDLRVRVERRPDVGHPADLPPRRHGDRAAGPQHAVDLAHSGPPVREDHGAEVQENVRVRVAGELGVHGVRLHGSNILPSRGLDASGHEVDHGLREVGAREVQFRLGLLAQRVHQVEGHDARTTSLVQNDQRLGLGCFLQPGALDEQFGKVTRQLFRRCIHAGELG